MVVIEKSETGFGAYVPDLPGCIAVAETEVDNASLFMNNQTNPFVSDVMKKVPRS